MFLPRALPERTCKRMLGQKRFAETTTYIPDGLMSFAEVTAVNWFRSIKQSNRKRNQTGNRRQRLSIEVLEDRRLLALIQGYDVQVRVDLYGSFGAEVHGRDAFDNNVPTSDAIFIPPLPPGVTLFAGDGGTVKETATAIGIDIDGDDVIDARQFLSTGCIDGSFDRYPRFLWPNPPFPTPCANARHGELYFQDPNARFVPDPDNPLTRHISTFGFPGHPFLDGVDVSLIQDLQALPDPNDPLNSAGAVLIQKYTITNNTGVDRLFDFQKYMDDDLIFIFADVDNATYFRTDPGPNADPIEYITHRDDDTGINVAIAILGGQKEDTHKLKASEFDFLIGETIFGTLPDNTIDTIPVLPTDVVVSSTFTDATSVVRTRVAIPNGLSETITVLNLWGNPADFPESELDLNRIPDLPTIDGVKYHDFNGNHVQDGNEPGLGGWRIELYREEPALSGNFNFVGFRDTNPVDGSYNFGSVLPGRYIIREDFVTNPQPGFDQTAPVLTPNNTNIIPDPFDGFANPDRTAYDITVGFDESFFGEFGNRRPHIGGSKFHDFNANGKRDKSEELLNNWQIELWEDDGDGIFEPYIAVAAGGDGQVPKAVQFTGATGTLGRYEFNNATIPNLLVGGNTYFIQETPIVDAPGIPGQPLQSDRWIQTRPSKGYFTINYQAGDVINGLDFGNIRIAGLSGLKFLDINGNGKQEANEPGLPGVKIFVDRDNNGVHNPSGNEEFAITGPDGRWTIPFVVPGPGLFTIAEELPKPQDLWVQTFPGASKDFVHKVSLLGGATVENLNFGNKGYSRITGQVFLDAAPTGIRNRDDNQGLANVYVWIDENGNGQPNVGEPGTYTNSDGTYDISPVDPLAGKNVAVRSTPRLGWAATFPTPTPVYNIRIEPGNVVVDNDFGDAPSIDRSSAPNPPYGEATHGVVPNVHLGAANLIDDGIAFQLVDVMGRGVVTAGGTEFVNITFGSAQPIVGAKLAVWVDSDLSGTFDADEEVITDVIYTPAGGTQFGIPITLPPEALPAGVNTTWMHARLSFQKGIGPNGHTSSGEVEDYEIRIRKPGENVNVAPNVVDLGKVVDVTRMAESIDGTMIYRGKATQTGLFAVTAAFVQAPNSDVAFVVYDRNTNSEVAASGAYVKGVKAATFQSKAGTEYEIRITGDHQTADLHFQNMVMVNSPATVVGTDGDDVVRFVAGKVNHVLTVNGVDYAFDAATNKDFIVLGKDGNDSITIVGDDRNDRARFVPGEFRLDAATYDLLVRDVEGINLDGAGGKNRLTVFDSPSHDVLEAGPAGPDNVKFSGDGFSVTASGIAKLNAISRSGGDDSATFRDTAGNDKLTSKPTKSVFKGDNLNNTVQGFATLDVIATSGNDGATVYDSRQKDLITAAPANFNISGDGFSNSAVGFDLVVVKSKPGDDDDATLTDSSGKDRLSAWPNSARFMGPGFRYDFFEIENISAESTHGGGDVVKFFGSIGNDNLVAAPNDILFTGTGFSRAATGFTNNYIHSHQGGYDTARVSDSAGNDVFTGHKSIFELTSDGSLVYGRGFDEVDLYGSTGKNSIEGDLDALDEVFGTWD